MPREAVSIETCGNTNSLWEEAVARVRRLFRAMKATAEEAGVGLVDVMIPTFEQVRPDIVLGDSEVVHELDLT